MIRAKLELRRIELYEKVWSIPMRALAKEFGISDVGLAKICRRHKIPLPGRGYWARIQYGQKPTKRGLPEVANAALESVTVCPSEPRPRGHLNPANGEEPPTLQVPTGRQVIHPVAFRIEQSLSKKTGDERGFLTTLQGRVVPVRVSVGSLSRAMRILDVLFTTFDESHYGFDWPKPYDKPLAIVIDQEKIRVTIAEVLKRSDHKSTPEDVLRQKTDKWWRPRQWDYHPTSAFRITIESCEFPFIQRSWSDGKRKKLEEYLGEVFVACKLTAVLVKKERVERAEAEVLRWEEEKRRSEKAAKQAEYDRKATTVKKFAEAWQEARLLRDFSRALKATIESAELSPDERLENEAMAEWSVRHADYVDPLTDLKWTLNQFKDPPWSFGY